MSSKITKEHFYLVLGPLCLLLLWFLVAHLLPQPNIYFPTLEETFSTLISLLIINITYLDIINTLFRTITAFLISILLAVPIAIGLGMNKKILKSVELIFDFFRTLPAIALLPLFIIIFGINDVARIAIATFTGFWMISVSILYGMLHMKQTRLELTKVMKANKKQQFIVVIFWEVLPSIFSGIKLALPLIYIVIIVSEMVASPNFGLGLRILNYQESYKIPETYALILIIGTLGYLLNKCLSLLEKRVIHWTGR